MDERMGVIRTIKRWITLGAERWMDLRIDIRQSAYPKEDLIAALTA